MRPWTVAGWLGASLVLAAAGLAAVPAGAQSPKSAAPPASGAAKPSVSKPLWRDLTARQQKALQPLAPYWDELTESHKRKWLALSRDYAKLSPADQEILHSRMTEWASLSNQQRAQARLNFADVKQVPVDERKAKWEAYQALSEEEKRKLAARAKASKPPGAAPTLHLVPEQKLVPIPAVGPDGQHAPRILLAPPPAPAPAVVTARPTPAPAPPPAPTVPPVSAEAQVPPPSEPEIAPKASEQPAAAP